MSEDLGGCVRRRWNSGRGEYQHVLVCVDGDAVHIRRSAWEKFWVFLTGLLVGVFL